MTASRARVEVVRPTVCWVFSSQRNFHSWASEKAA